MMSLLLIQIVLNVILVTVLIFFVLNLIGLGDFNLTIRWDGSKSGGVYEQTKQQLNNFKKKKHLFSPKIMTTTSTMTTYYDPVTTSYPVAGKTSYPVAGTTSYPEAGTTSYPMADTASYPVADATSYTEAATTSYATTATTSYATTATTSYATTATTSYTTTNYIEAEFYSKLMVISGATLSSPLTSVEIIDYVSPTTYCSQLPDVPFPAESGIGGIDFQGNPQVCGGNGNGRQCWLFDSGQWIDSNLRMISNRFWTAAINPDVQNSSTKLFAIGGYTTDSFSSLNTMEYFTPNGWEQTPVNFITEIYQHCIVAINSSTILVIGGNQGGSITSNTYFLTLETFKSSTGPTLKTIRQEQSCGVIPTTINDSERTIVAAGGWTGNYELNSVELIDLRSMTNWRYGDYLPYTMYRGTSVGEPNGGMLIIGGTYWSLNVNILRLKSADSQWEILPQKLTTGRHSAVVFWIPKNFTTCN